MKSFIVFWFCASYFRDKSRQHKKSLSNTHREPWKYPLSPIKYPPCDHPSESTGGYIKNMSAFKTNQHFFKTNQNHTLPESNIAPKIDHPKRKGSSPNYHGTGAKMLVSGKIYIKFLGLQSSISFRVLKKLPYVKIFFRPIPKKKTRDKYPHTSGDHHLRCMKLCELWGKLPMIWYRIVLPSISWVHKASVFWVFMENCGQCHLGYKIYHQKNPSWPPLLWSSNNLSRNRFHPRWPRRFHGDFMTQKIM